ncbi:MAG: hypothetical protein FWB90_00135 [Fibromonadales bacterium]|nr:hypothetical protein [Fibromonadales bacterium]
MKNRLLIFKIFILAAVLAMSASSQNSELNEFSIMPPRISSVSVQKNSEWEGLLIVFDFQIPRETVPVITDTTVDLSISGGPSYSGVFQIAKSSFAKGLAWSEGKLSVYLHRGKKPAVMIMKNRLLLQDETSPGKLENWKASPTSLNSSVYYLPSYEPLALRAVDFAGRFMDRKSLETLKYNEDSLLRQTIQVKRQDASYLVTEDIAYLYPTPHDGKHLEVLEFGDRLKVLDKVPSFYKVRYHSREGYVFQRDIVQEAELTAEQKEKLRDLKKDIPGSVDSIAEKFAWADSKRKTYSSFGFRDPFREVKSMDTTGINIDNLTLVGIIYENEKPMALFSNNKARGLSYTLFEGDSVKNGKVLKISKTDVLFLLTEYRVSRRHKVSLPDKYGSTKK